MTQYRIHAALATILLGSDALLLAAATPTFSKDVAPILQRSCQECHRPGEIGPFPLLTYEQARPWAAAIKASVVQKKMPPWFADPHYGRFSNDRSLSQKDIDTLVSWASGGAPKGDPKDLPAPASFTSGWEIPEPDVVFQLPEPYQIPATGTIEYLHWLIPTNFKTDKWVQFAEARPGDRTHVHHIIAYVREPGSQWMKDIKPGIPFIPEKPKADGTEDTSQLPSDFLVGYAPGQPAERFEPGKAKLVKAGSDIILQVHYTTNGKPSTDVTRVGLVFAKEPPTQRVMTFSATNGKFKIPARRRPRLQGGCRIRIGHHGDPVRPASSHACSRQGLPLSRPVPRWQDGNAAQRPSLQLCLAALVQPRKADRLTEGHQDPLHRPFRQLSEQPLQPRPQ